MLNIGSDPVDFTLLFEKEWGNSFTSFNFIMLDMCDDLKPKEAGYWIRTENHYYASVIDKELRNQTLKISNIS